MIFRPYHEAGGTWFWWSVEGGSQYNRLWRYTYDYMARGSPHNQQLRRPPAQGLQPRLNGDPRRGAQPTVTRAGWPRCAATPPPGSSTALIPGPWHREAGAARDAAPAEGCRVQPRRDTSMSVRRAGRGYAGSRKKLGCGGRL
ncbi:hypothetical protein KBX63_25515 [Micromonospora sp. U21]|nr:hypothetical protein [Micromonospora sp. U21]